MAKPRFAGEFKHVAGVSQRLELILSQIVGFHEAATLGKASQAVNIIAGQKEHLQT